MHRVSALVIALVVLTALGAGAEPAGMLEGTVVPSDAVAEVSALQDGTVIATTNVGSHGGRFRLPLAAGTYTIMVTAPVSSFPVLLEGVVVNAGGTTTLLPVQILPGASKAVLEGRIIPPQAGREVTLLSEGRERAVARTDREGRYEFRGLPAGLYEVRASAPGFAEDIAPVVVPENQRLQQTSVLLPAVTTEGVDWAAGKIRATGVGHPPKEAVNPASVRAMTQRAAVADAQRNLLRIVKQIKIDGARSVGIIMSTRNGAERIQGFLKGFTVASERDLGDGSIEVVLELPLTGPSGLSRYVAE